MNYCCEFAQVDKTLAKACITKARVCELPSIDAGKDKRRLCWNYDKPAAVDACWIHGHLARMGEIDAVVQQETP